MTDSRVRGPDADPRFSDPNTRMLFGSPAAQIVMRIARVHEQRRVVTERLSEDQMTWRPSVDTPPIQFHLWHMAR